MTGTHEAYLLLCSTIFCKGYSRVVHTFQDHKILNNKFGFFLEGGGGLIEKNHYSIFPERMKKTT